MKFINNIRRFGDNIFRWFSYLPVLWRAYDFDYSSILSVERHQIKRVRDSINHYRNHVNWKQDVASMNLALRLLDIIEENGVAELLCDEPFKFKDNGYLELNSDAKWKMGRYVNTKNASRFNPKWTSEHFEDPKTGVLIKDHLRVEKAWQLYHKLRQYKLRTWWD